MSAASCWRPRSTATTSPTTSTPLFTVYLILIFARIVISWVIMFRGSLPYNRPLRAVTDFIAQSVDPYLNLFRRILPPIGGSRMALDLSPIIGIFILILAAGDRRRADPAGERRDERAGARRRARRAGVTMLVAVAADQLAQGDRPRLDRARARPSRCCPGVDLVRVANEGVAFGLFDSALLRRPGRWSRSPFTAALGWSCFARRRTAPGLWLPIGLLAGGAVGNLIDRIARRLASPTSSTCRPGPPSTSPTSRSPSACCCSAWILLARARAVSRGGPRRPASPRSSTRTSGWRSSTSPPA